MDFSLIVDSLGSFEDKKLLRVLIDGGGKSSSCEGVVEDLVVLVPSVREFSIFPFGNALAIIVELLSIRILTYY